MIFLDLIITGSIFFFPFGRGHLHPVLSGPSITEPDETQETGRNQEGTFGRQSSGRTGTSLTGKQDV